MNNYYIDHYVKVLRKGELLLYPTDTVWGIGCDATDKVAVERIFNLKRRHESKSMVILVHSLEMLKQYVSEIPQVVIELIQSTIAPTSIIYSNPKDLASNVIAEDNTVAIRLVKDEFCELLIEKLGKPIVSTSANISGEPTPKNFNEISEEIKKNVDCIVNWRQDEKIEKTASHIVKINPDGSLYYIR